MLKEPFSPIGVRAGELTFKKGRLLTHGDIQALRLLGVETVMACKLDQDDVAEDEAAAAIAATAEGDHVEAERPFTGRVNLRARDAGILIIERSRVDRLNHVDEAITIATLPPLAVVRKGQLAATVKIIPFAVPRAKLDLAVAAVGSGSPLIDVAPFKPWSVVLIQTRLPGVKESILDKTVDVTSRRLRALGGRLIGDIRCPHETTVLADKLKASPRGSGAGRRCFCDHRSARCIAGGGRVCRRRGGACRHAG